MRWLLKPARSVICVSEKLAEAMRGCGVEAAHCIPNGVHIQAADTGEDDEPYVLYAGRLAPEKGIHELLEATEGMKLVAAGDGPLRELVPSALGFVPHDELVRLYEKAAVVVCSSYGEGLPLCVIEAMAYGRPGRRDDRRRDPAARPGRPHRIPRPARRRAGPARPDPEAARRSEAAAPLRRGRPRADREALLLGPGHRPDPRGVRPRPRGPPALPAAAPADPPPHRGLTKLVLGLALFGAAPLRRVAPRADGVARAPARRRRLARSRAAR